MFSNRKFGQGFVQTKDSKNGEIRGGLNLEVDCFFWHCRLGHINEKRVSRFHMMDC